MRAAMILLCSVVACAQPTPDVQPTRRPMHVPDPWQVQEDVRAIMRGMNNARDERASEQMAPR